MKIHLKQALCLMMATKFSRFQHYLSTNMSVGKNFPAGSNSGLFQVEAQCIFPREVKSDEISIYQLHITRKTFLLKA